LGYHRRSEKPEQRASEEISIIRQVSFQCSRILDLKKLHCGFSFIAAGAAVLIASWFKDHPYMPLTVAPAIAIIWWWTKAHKARLESIPWKV